MPPFDIAALLKYGWIVFGGWFWHTIKKRDQLLDDVAAKQAKSPTNDEVDAKIEKAISVIKEDQKELLVMVREMSINLNQLMRDIAVLNALRSRSNDSDKHS